MKMYKIKSQSIVIFLTVASISGENWYSATVHLDKGVQSKDLKKSYVYKVPYNFVPLTTSTKYKSDLDQKVVQKNLNTIKFRPHTNNSSYPKNQLNTTGFYGFSDIHLDYYSTYRNRTNKPLDVLNFNNTVNVINLIKRNRPKIRIIKRRCPDMGTRVGKQTDLNQFQRKRFLEVFQVVEFEHVACISSSGLEGTCVHEYECESMGGSPMGTCADGYGTCCVTLFQCDGTSSEHVGWFTNPGFPMPSSERLSCTFTLNKASDDIKQLRLDFMSFELLGPTDGTCQHDQFIVSGQNINSIIPILCGINTGQHVYVEVSDTAGPIYLSVQTFSSENRLYAIKVSQLTWADELAAPTGCLQYFTETEGYLESFNYRDRSDIGISRNPSYFNNLNYAMCINRVQETCSVTYTNADIMQIVNYDLDGLPIMPQGQAGVEIYNCPSDWLLIAATRLCGDRFNDGSILQDFSLDAPVTDTNAGPIAVWFRSDEGYVGTGFKLQYKQNTCNSPA